MPARDFKTVADELLHVAADAEKRFTTQGYHVEIEQRHLGFPFIPTLICRRRHETLIVEVSSRLDQIRTQRWIRFCRSQTKDLKFVIVLRNLVGIDTETLNFAISQKLGLFCHNDIVLTEVRSGSDLAVHVELPNIQDLEEAVRPLLAPAFQKIEEGDWRDGLNQAFLEAEQAARDYLKAEVEAGRKIVLATKKGRQVRKTASEIDKMTMGQLTFAYNGIQNQTHKDAEIGSTLASINETRVGLAHKRGSPAVEAKLRLQAGQHIYAVISCLELISSMP